MLKKIVTYTLLIITILSLLVFAVKQFILPSLKDQIRDVVLVEILAISIVLNALANLNETIELISRFFKKGKEHQNAAEPQPTTAIQDYAHGNTVLNAREINIHELNINPVPRKEEKPLIIDKNNVTRILRAINKNGYVKNEFLDSYLAREYKFPTEIRIQIIEELNEHGYIERKSEITIILGKGKEYIN